MNKKSSRHTDTPPPPPPHTHTIDTHTHTDTDTHFTLMFFHRRSSRQRPESAIPLLCPVVEYTTCDTSMHWIVHPLGNTPTPTMSTHNSNHGLFLVVHIPLCPWQRTSPTGTLGRFPTRKASCDRIAPTQPDKSLTLQTYIHPLTRSMDAQCSVIHHTHQCTSHNYTPPANNIPSQRGTQ